MEILPRIQDKKIVEVIVDGQILGLKKFLDISELGNLIDVTEKFMTYYDISGFGLWPKEDFFEFLEESSEGQRALLEIVSKEGEVLRGALLDEIKATLNDPEFTSRKLTGALTGISIRTKSWEKEKFVESSWSRKYEDYNYKIKKPYDEWILEWCSKNSVKGSSS